MPPVFPCSLARFATCLIADTFSSLVWKVSLPDGTPAIVKGLKPIKDIADELRGADYLVWRNGRGAVGLLGRENNLMLLDIPGNDAHIAAEHGDYQATEIAAELNGCAALVPVLLPFSNPNPLQLCLAGAR